MLQDAVTTEREARRRTRHDARTQRSYQAFLKLVAYLTDLPGERVEDAAVSVISAIERRLFGNASAKLEAQLPSKLRERLAERADRGEGHRFRKDELVDFVAQDLGVSREHAERIAHGVLRAVRLQVSEGEFEHVRRQLPAEVAALWEIPGRLGRAEE